jgi:hypothetical protein
MVGVAGLPAVILGGGDSKEKALYFAALIKGFVFLSLMQTSLQRSEKQSPFS